MVIPEPMSMVEHRYPVTIEGELEEGLSRWLWLVKWLLLIPHFFVLLFLWLAAAVVWVIALFAILFTGRYPRGLFDFELGVMRWTWRVAFYSYYALGTDRYPPFSLNEEPDYPATLDVAYPVQLSRGLVLVKWWLLVIPQALVVGILEGGWGWGWHTDEAGWVANIGLIGVLVLIAAVMLLFTGALSTRHLQFRHGPRPLGLPRRRVRPADARRVPTLPARPGAARAGRSAVDRLPRARRGILAVRLDVLHVSRLRLDAREPGAEARIRLQVEPGLVGAMRIAVHRDVRDRVPVGDEEVARGQVLVQQLQHLERAGAPPLGLRMFGRPAADEQAEPEAADHEHDVRLLVDQPAHDLCPLPRIVGEKRRAVREIRQDRVRLRQVRPSSVSSTGTVRIGLMRAYSSVSVPPAKMSTGTRSYSDAEVGEQEPHLVAIAGGAVVVELHPW